MRALLLFCKVASSGCPRTVAGAVAGAGGALGGAMAGAGAVAGAGGGAMAVGGGAIMATATKLEICHLRNDKGGFKK